MIRLHPFTPIIITLLVILAGIVNSDCSCCWCPWVTKVERVYEVGLAAAKLVGTILNMAPLIARTYKNPSGPVCKSVIPPKPSPNLSRGIYADDVGSLSIGCPFGYSNFVLSSLNLK